MATKRTREFWVGQVHQHGRKFRFSVERAGKPYHESYETRGEADAARREYARQAQAQGVRSIGKAIEAYELHSLDQNGLGNKPRTVETKLDRLRNFFDATERELSLDRLTEARCLALYQKCKSKLAVDTHRGALSVTKTFLNYCVDQKWIPRNPLLAIKGEGKRKKGKEQLRIDEARKWYDTALALCVAGGQLQESKVKGGRPTRYGHAGPAAALTCLVLGLRADEVASRTVRDLDDNGTVLWVTDAKTEAGNRKQEVPEELQLHLRALTLGKLPTAKLFGGRRWWVRKWVQRICQLAEVPVVGAHSMRGLHATLAIKNGASAAAVIVGLGHADIRVTKEHYVEAGAMEQAAQARAFDVIKGGKR